MKRRHKHNKHNKYKNKKWLKHIHIKDKKTPAEIASICNVSKQTILNWIKKFKLDPDRYEKNKRNRRRKAAKKRRRNMAYKLLGDKCAVCGYNKCRKALEFHHLDPSEKEYNISNGLNKPWAVLQRELEKCCLLCKVCHVEVHEGLVELEYEE